MTFRELFYKAKNAASKTADWSVSKTAIISTIILGLISISYWIYLENEKYKSWVYYSNQQYFTIAKKMYYQECIANGTFISKQLLKNEDKSSLHEVCNYDAGQSASMFAGFRSEKVSFIQYLLGTFPVTKSSEQIEFLAKKSAVEHENSRVRIVEEKENHQ